MDWLEEVATYKSVYHDDPMRLTVAVFRGMVAVAWKARAKINGHWTEEQDGAEVRHRNGRKKDLMRVLPHVFDPKAIDG